jgi:hypothetical protein
MESVVRRIVGERGLSSSGSAHRMQPRIGAWVPLVVPELTGQQTKAFSRAERPPDGGRTAPQVRAIHHVNTVHQDRCLWLCTSSQVNSYDDWTLEEQETKTRESIRVAFLSQTSHEPVCNRNVTMLVTVNDDAYAVAQSPDPYDLAARLAQMSWSWRWHTC